MSPRTTPLQVGVIGAGMIAQIMHLPYLEELRALFDVRAVCDGSEQVAQACGRRFGIEHTFTDWRELLDEDLDAVFVLTSGSHAEIAVAAADAGLHTFVEKPMCYSVAEADDMIGAAERAGVVLMVGYPKRYDPAYRRVADEVAGLRDLRFVRLTTMEAPARAYTEGYELAAGAAAPELVAAWRADSAARVDAALGPVTALQRRSYEGVLLDTMVHEFNLLRGLLGEPSQVTSVSLRETTTTVMLEFSGVDCVVSWLDLPGLANYEMELCVYDPDTRVRLTFPSPYLKQTPTPIEIERGHASTPSLVVARERVSFASPFKLELLEFHRAIREGTEPLTGGHDGRCDIALCQNIIAAAVSGRPVPYPTAEVTR